MISNCMVIFLYRKLKAFLIICTLVCCISSNLRINSICGKELETKQVNADAFTDGEIQSKSAILIEKVTGKVLFEKNADEIVSPASITKIMTLILVFDAIHNNEISLEDEVTTSEYAKSMGGSQVFLETGEKQTVETLIKCIVIASGNDASVTMAEYIAGSEEAFVAKMNERADGLGMSNTVFKDCCGLCDSMEHHTTARDVAIMSRELISKYPEIFNYSGIWMENITHVTDKGSKEFTLANTNKLLKQYDWVTGLKTGSTSLAKYCMSATGNQNGIELIAVVMGAPDYKIRFGEAAMLLRYGYANVSIYEDECTEIPSFLKVSNGKEEKVSVRGKEKFTYICMNGENKNDIVSKISIDKKIKAPVYENQKVGCIEYYMGEEKIGEIEIVSAENIRKSGYIDYLQKMWYKYMV